MKFQHILWLLITIAIVPVGVNLILLCPTPLSIPVLGQPVEWISFWGNYASNIVYIVVTIYVLISTQKQTKIQMVTQIKSVQLQTRLENLRNQLIGNILIHSRTIVIHFKNNILILQIISDKNFRNIR